MTSAMGAVATIAWSRRVALVDCGYLFRFTHFDPFIEKRPPRRKQNLKREDQQDHVKRVDLRPYSRR